MLGQMNWQSSSWLDLTFRELVIRRDAYLLSSWDHTAAITCSIHNLMVLTRNINAKHPMKPSPITDFHPYRRLEKKGTPLTSNNLHALKFLAYKR